MPEGTPDSTVVAVKRVNELDFYSLGLHDLARKLGVNETHLLWLIRRDRMQEDADFFKAIRIGKSTHKRYSGKCYEALRAKLTRINLNAFHARPARPYSAHVVHICANMGAILTVLRWP